MHVLVVSLPYCCIDTLLMYACFAGILLTSHYPLYCSICANRAASNVSARAWAGAEFGEAMDVAGPGELTVGAMQQTMLADLEPLMLQYGVDVK